MIISYSKNFFFLFVFFQEAVIDSYRISRKDRKRLTDFQNPCHPLMPLRLSLEKLSRFEDEDSSDEENRQKVS